MKEDLDKIYFSNFRRLDIKGVPCWLTRTGCAFYWVVLLRDRRMGVAKVGTEARVFPPGSPVPGGLCQPGMLSSSRRVRQQPA